MADRKPALSRELGLRDLVLFNIAAVVGIRWLAAAAHVGPESIGLWLAAAAFFFVPSALAVSRLTAKLPEEGGLYTWTRASFGDWHGFLCGWCYWLSNLFFFPNLLLAGIGMAVYGFGASHAWLGDSRLFVIPVSLALLWVGTITNLVGLRVGKWTQNVGGLATYAAGLLLIGLGAAVWATRARPRRSISCRTGIGAGSTSGPRSHSPSAALSWGPSWAARYETPSGTSRAPPGSAGWPSRLFTSPERWRCWRFCRPAKWTSAPA